MLGVDTSRDLGNNISYWENCVHLLYEQCPSCFQDGIRNRLLVQGVPRNLLHATLKNWDGDADILSKVRNFATDKRGFLILLGNCGVGKTHLAVGVMRKIQSSWLVKQSTLLIMQRDTYGDTKAEDPIDKAKYKDLLVLDELGISGGGKDEGPMLYEILSFRYEQMLPTILTSNLSWEQFKTVIGERMGDRLYECAYAVLTIGGESYRAKMKDDYFKQVVPAMKDDHLSTYGRRLNYMP
jgi:DNA replication protein DnaC